MAQNASISENDDCYKDNKVSDYLKGWNYGNYEEFLLIIPELVLMSFTFLLFSGF